MMLIATYALLIPRLPIATDNESTLSGLLAFFEPIMLSCCLSNGRQILANAYFVPKLESRFYTGMQKPMIAKAAHENLECPGACRSR